MNAALSDAYFHDALVDRRKLLLRTGRAHTDETIGDLLARVDAALARLDRGTFGICERCHEHIEADHLVRDPLAEYCREHPGPREETRIRRDLALAREIQRGLLPRADLDVAGWQYAYRYEPAGDVGGDFCDVIARPRGETLVVVGDVAGKGVAASMLMSHLLATFRSLAALPLATGDLLARANDLFHGSISSATYATIAAASLHPNGLVELYSAGHWTPIVRRGRVSEAVTMTPGLPLGLFPGSSFGATPLALARNDSLLFFTDGTIDAENDDGEEYGFGRLTGAFGAAAGDSITARLGSLHADVRRFQGRHPADDDMLLFGVMATA